MPKPKAPKKSAARKPAATPTLAVSLCPTCRPCTSCSPENSTYPSATLENGSPSRAITGSAPCVPTAARTPFPSGDSGSTAPSVLAPRSSRKARILAHNAAVSVHLDSGDDVVIVEGTAVEVALTDTQTFKKLDAASRAKYEMPLMVTPESVVYSVRPRGVLAWTEKDFPKNATRWEFR